MVMLLDFAEGITIMNDRIYMLTYHEKTMLIFSTSTLELLQRVSYDTSTGEGWGLTIIFGREFQPRLYSFYVKFNL